MKVALVQEHPQPIFEVQDYASSNDFNSILAWLHRTDLPEDLSLSFEGTMYRFRNRFERVQFALGFDKAFDLLDDEPKLPLDTDFDGTAFVCLGTASNQKGLEHFATELLQELYLSKWPDHFGDIQVYASNSCSLRIKCTVWASLSIRQKQMMAARCQGYCEALDAVYETP